MELPEDIWFQVMYEADYNVIKSLSLTNKYTQTLYHDNNFWKMKVEKDYPFAINYSTDYFTLYSKLENFFHTKTLDIVDTNNEDFAIVVDEYISRIKKILVQHIAQLLNIVDKPSKEKRAVKNTIADDTFKKIIDVFNYGNDEEDTFYINYLIGSLITSYMKKFGLKLKIY